MQFYIYSKKGTKYVATKDSIKDLEGNFFDKVNKIKMLKAFIKKEERKAKIEGESKKFSISKRNAC